MTKNEITIQDIAQSLLSHLALILAVTMLFGAAAWGVTKFLVTPQYTATAKLFAYSNADRSSNDYVSSEAYAARTMVNTYIVILRSDTVMQEVSNKLKEDYGLTYSVGALQSMTSAAAVGTTEVFNVTITGSNREDLKPIADTVAKVAEIKVVDIVGSGGVNIVDLAKEPRRPTSPNVSKNTIMGALVGLLLISLIVILRDLYDTTIWTEDDLSKQFEVPLLGLIPQLLLNETSANQKE